MKNRDSFAQTAAPSAARHSVLHLVLAAAFLVLACSETQARVETKEEAKKIMAFLEKENCEVIRDAMGETKVMVVEPGFKVEAKCADGEPYVFTLDEKFDRVEKKPRAY